MRIVLDEASEGDGKRSYTTVSIPLVLAHRIDKIVESGRGGYTNRTDFVLDAVRTRLRELDMLE